MMIALIIDIKSNRLCYGLFCLVVKINQLLKVLRMSMWTQVCSEDRERTKISRCR